LRVNSPSFSGRIVPLFDTMLVHQGEGSRTPTEPHYTPSPETDPSYHTTSSMPLPSITTAPIPPVTQTKTTPIRQYTRRARIAQSSALFQLSIDEGEAATKKISDDSEELARVLTSMDAATVVAGGINVPIGSGFIPTASPPVGDIPTSSDNVPTASPVFATAIVVTPYSRRKG
nr:hypothetical protein [Tanacetum cinerariifolium]